MTNEIGLTWEQLKKLCERAYIYIDGIEEQLAFDVINYCEGKSGPINIVEEDKIQEDELGCYEALEYSNEQHDYVRCGKKATHKCKESEYVIILLCSEHAKQYEGAEAL